MDTDAPLWQCPPAMPPPASPRPPFVIRLWIQAAFLVFFAACLHEAFGPFVIGHDGFNGAAFSHAARNSLRFGMLQQVQYYTGFSAPPLSEVYTNHPLLLHVHLIALLGATSVEPWLARLVPIAYSLAFFILLYRVVARRVGHVEAAIAITIWTLTPLHTIFANMVNHEQGGLFWCLFLVDRYLILHDARRGDTPAPPTSPPTPRARQWPIFLAVSFAMQFDWVGYYFAFFIGAHALAAALLAREITPPVPFGARIRRLGFTVRFSAIVIFNAVLFFGWIALLRGGLGAMGEAFSQRSHRPDGYLQLLLDRSLDLYGAGLLILLGLWLVFAIIRLLRGRATSVDFIPWTFALAQLIHSTVFQSAGAIHSYWTFYAGPALAIGGALFLSAAFRTLTAAIGRFSPSPARLARFIAVPIIAIATIAQARHALREHIAGHDNHRGSYLVGASDEWLETQWARQLHALHGRDGTCYVLHPSADRTIHVLYYLDAPRQDGYSALNTTAWIPPPDPACQRHILLVDLERIAHHQFDSLATLARRHGARVLDRRLVAVDLKSQAPTDGSWLTAELLTPEPAPWWWTWLVNSRNPPFRIVPDPDQAWLESGGLLEPAKLGKPMLAGGTTGLPREIDCPDGSVVDGIIVQRQDALVGAMTFICNHLPDGLSARDDAPQGPMSVSTFTIGRDRGPGARLECPRNSLMTGLRGRAGTLIDAIGPLCTTSTPAQPRSHRADPLQRRLTRLEGGPGGSDFELDCPAGERLVGISAWAGDLVDGVAVRCAPYPALMCREAQP